MLHGCRPVYLMVQKIYWYICGDKNFIFVQIWKQPQKQVKGANQIHDKQPEQATVQITMKQFRFWNVCSFWPLTLRTWKIKIVLQ